MKIGVYICHCGTNIAGTVDVAKVREFAKTLPGVVVSRDYRYMCSDPGQELIKKDIKELSLDRVVVAACTPRMHEPTFRQAISEAGLNPYLLDIANIREQCSWTHKDREKATDKARDLIRMAVAKARLLEPLDAKEVGVTHSALVIGGGIAGIQAALDIAEEGFKVYLVEKDPSIGGRMAQLDKTFPTLDCSACILTPKMVDAARHPNIELLTYSEVVKIDGYIGNFKVKVLRKPRYVDEEKCNGCGDCASSCPYMLYPHEFDMGLRRRGNIYIPFPQAVPLIYVIDGEHCTRCGNCNVICEPRAIDFYQKPKEIELNVGAIVMATGYDVMEPALKPEFKYGVYDNVITGMELERLCSASGPTEGKIIVKGKEPKKIVFIQCVGSRDEKTNTYCSRVCCMYTAKHAHLVKEKVHDAEVTVFYIDVRAFGKGFEEFYDRVRKEGIIYRRGNVGEVVRSADGKGLIVKAEDTLLGELVEVEADLVVLATAIVPKKDAEKMARLLNISRGADKFFLEAHPKLRPVDTLTDGVFLAGCCQGPKDIPDTVAQASGAAARACGILSKERWKVEGITATINEEICAGCGVCEEICPFGAIEVADVAKVNAILCKGCGACSAACPSGANKQKHFRPNQIMAMVDAALEA
jgi:heterodisulfide reductase subunit A